jgi:hypothetical protein
VATLPFSGYAAALFPNRRGIDDVEFVWHRNYFLENSIIVENSLPAPGVMRTTMTLESRRTETRQLVAAERFEGNAGLVTLFGVASGLLLALVAYVLVEAMRQFPTFSVYSAISGVFGLGSLVVAGLFLLYAAREAGASFTIDDEGIRRDAWGRSTYIAWRDLVGLREFAAASPKEKTGSSGRCVLQDVVGRRLVIPFPWVVNQSHFRAAVEPHLMGVRAAQERDLARDGGRFHPDRLAGILVLTFMTPLFLLCGLSIFEPASADGALDSTSMRFLCVVCLIAAPLLALLGVELIKRELTITPTGLALNSLFLARSIPFDRVESISVKTQRGEDRVAERAKVRGIDGQTIAFYSDIPGYRAILSLIESRAGAKLHGLAINDPEFS